MDIEHELVVAAPIDRVFACFSTGPGLAASWNDASTAEPRLGGRYTFGFDAEHQWAGVVQVYDAPHAIEWEMTETAPMEDWRSTRVGARLVAEGEVTRLHFYHRGWDGKTAHQRTSSFCWAMYLRLLARYCTSGEVVPYARPTTSEGRCGPRAAARPRETSPRVVKTRGVYGILCVRPYSPRRRGYGSSQAVPGV